MYASIAKRLYREDKGVYAILFAIIIIVLFTMIAIAIDLSNARAAVRENQSRTDLAALAAAAHLPGLPQAACAEAWNYILLNIPDLPSTATSPCSGFPASCTAATSAVRDDNEYEAGGEEPYQITFIYPVGDNDPLMTAEGQDIGVADGSDKCERFAVEIITGQDVLFGGIVGSGGLDAPATAVSRGGVQSTGGTAIALLLLDPTGCDALLSSGQGGVAIFSHDIDNTGRITVDSNGQKPSNPNVCGNNKYTIDNSSVSQGQIKACGNNYIATDPTRCDPGGVLELFGMDAGQTTCLPSAINHACDPVDIANGRLYPIPQKADERSTRQPVDWEFNCKTNYPNYAPYGASGVTVPISNCPNAGSMPNYIDQLDAGVNLSGNALPGADWTEWTDCSPADGTVIPPGNYYVSCTSFVVGSGNTVTFQGGNLVFRGDVTARGTLRVNTANPVVNYPDICRRPNNLTTACLLLSSSRHSFMVLRNGGELSTGAQGSLEMNHVMVRLSAGGGIGIGAGTVNVEWSGPLTRGFPTEDDPATPNVNEESAPGPFDKLALWSESSATHTLGGQAPLDVEGVFFVPLGLFNFDGQATQFLDKAQFLTFRMNVSGQGQLRMQPNPRFVLQFPFQGVRLIR